MLINKKVNISEKIAFLKIIEISEKEITLGRSIPIEKAFEELQTRIAELKKIGSYKDKKKP